MVRIFRYDPFAPVYSAQTDEHVIYGALFTDMNVFDNVAYPLREHTQLPAPLLHSTVMMKLEAVGLRERLS